MPFSWSVEEEQSGVACAHHCLCLPDKRDRGAGGRLALSRRRGDGPAGRSEAGFGQLKAHVGSDRFASLEITLRDQTIVDEQHGVTGDTELLGKRPAGRDRRTRFQPPAKDEVAQLREKLALQ